MQKNLVNLIYETYKLFADKEYIVDSNNRWSYSNIWSYVSAFAALLREKGVTKGDRVLLYIENSVEYVIAYFAILACNGIVVPINRHSDIKTIQYIIDKTEPILMVTKDNMIRSLPDDIINYFVFDIDELQHNESNIEQVQEVEESQIAMIIYTSGTTSLPKGVVLSHANLYANTTSILSYLNLTSDDSLLVSIDFSYSYGNSLLLTHTKVGGTLYIENKASYPIKVLESLKEFKMTGYSTVGSYLNILLKQSYISDDYFKQLKYITFAGESIYSNDIAKLLKLAPHLKIFIMYGQTEAGARLSYLDPDLILTKQGSVGKGIPGVKLKVVNDLGQEVVQGELGEIIACGDNIMLGYWKDPESTKEVIRDNWLYTGDLATVDEDGFIYIKGRKKDIIKYLGYRISPVEIESAINEFEQVLESAVIEINTEQGVQIKAFVVAKYGAVDIDMLQKHLRKRLVSFKRPHIIEEVDKIPRTTNGKIKRSFLKKQ